MHDPFDFNPKPKQFTVIGHPIEHSLSPQIHRKFARQADVSLVYTKTLGEAGGFNQAVQHFMASDGAGVNVTVPFKLDAFALCDSITDRARTAGAVNTIWFEEDKIFGDMTDGVGMVRDIEQNQGVELTGKRILVIGAGGAVRGVLQPLLAANPSELILCNRTEGTAIELAAEFKHQGNIQARAMNDLQGESFDIIINGTSASLSDDLPAVPPSIFKQGCFAYDMMYAHQPTIFMKWAMNKGAGKVSDGLGMLVEQAAVGFEIWHGKTVNTAPVIENLRQGV
ncbi:MAG: shikimate dehydrogenase [Arenicellales bacterium]